MLRVETIFFKGFKHRIRLTKIYEKQGFKVTNCCELGYIMITQEVPEC